ncbi:nucleoid-associated protein YgaU [Modestobacter versicolor]|uniref:Nucleoid-associated protein YgaU n=2 Tax=Modestobacter versicolor TaxID=429133 RepID=A0A839Y7D0_9ACTN|nr:LysM peptidoglycan-binding domain-containing protein [Modestobacter versicolor]MBB3678297.1 nucleoid-associated protein YgaU [Modestobacter versicolor]
MASPQRSVPASSPVPARGVAPAGRGPQSVAPPVRRDAVRPGARPARFDGLGGGRSVRGGCAVEPAALPRPAAHPRAAAPGPLRLTRRGRRALSGLSIAIGLSIAVATVAVELGQADGGLELAGSSTVVVQPGDTLWSIAGEVAPEEDRRAVVDALVDANDLDAVELVPGQVLQLP